MPRHDVEMKRPLQQAQDVLCRHLEGKRQERPPATTKYQVLASALKTFNGMTIYDHWMWNDDTVLEMVVQPLQGVTTGSSGSNMTPSSSTLLSSYLLSGQSVSLGYYGDALTAATAYNAVSRLIRHWCVTLLILFPHTATRIFTAGGTVAWCPCFNGTTLL